MADNPRSGWSRRRRLNGEGTISGPRKDGRYVGAFYTRTSAGTIKRAYVYGKTWAQARDRLVEEQPKSIRGIPAAAESWKLGVYLEYWLENIVKPSRRAATYSLYESIIRLYLKPGLGHHWLRRLSLPIVQVFLNAQLAQGMSVRNVHIMREVLSAALTQAVREELIGATSPVSPNSLAGNPVTSGPGPPMKLSSFSAPRGQILSIRPSCC